MELTHITLNNLKKCLSYGFFSGNRLYSFYFHILNNCIHYSSLIWSIGCTVNEDGRKKLDVLIREKEGVFPLKDTVYEYYVDVKMKCYMAWEDKLSSGWRYNTE